MKHNRKKISKIVDELAAFCFSIGAEDMNIHIKKDHKDYVIELTSDFNPDDISKVERLHNLLNPIDRNIGFAGAYWELVGESDPGYEIQLNLVGQIIDDAKVSIEGNMLYLTIHKNY